MRSKHKNFAESADFGGGLRSPSDSSSRSLSFFSKCPTTPLNGVSGRVLLPDQIDPGRDQVAGQNFSPDSNSEMNVQVLNARGNCDIVKLRQRQFDELQYSKAVVTTTI